MFRFQRGRASFEAGNRPESERYNPRMSAQKTLAVAMHVLAILCIGTLLSGCDSGLAGLVAGQASASSPSPDIRSLTQTQGAVPPSSPSPSPTASNTPPPPTPSLSVPTPVNLLLESGTIAYALRRNNQSTIYLLPLGSPVAMPLALGSDDRDPVFSPQGTALAYSSRRDGDAEIYVTDLVSGEFAPAHRHAGLRRPPGLVARWAVDRLRALRRFTHGHLHRGDGGRPALLVR